MERVDTTQLKEKILKLAFAGKLAIQKENDKPVSFLLDDTNQSKGKQDKKISIIYCGEDEKYFEQVGTKVKNVTNEVWDAAPKSWERVRLKELGKFGMGQTILTKEMTTNGVPVYSATVDDNPLGFCPKEKVRIRLSEGDLVIPARGASIGYLTYIKDEFATCTQTTIYCKFYKPLMPKFLYYQFMSNKEYFFPVSGTAQPQLVISNLTKKIVLLPPLEEQERIVKKIDNLFNKINEIEHKQNELDELKELTKKKILNLAVVGKLVEQNLNGESANLLLERIQSERKKEKGIRKKQINNKDLETEQIVNNQKDKDIPSNWTHTKFKNVTSLTSGNDLNPSEYWTEKNGIPYLTGASNIKNGKIIINRYTNSNYKNSALGDILLTCKGTIGKISINNIGDVHIARQFMGIKSYINKEYTAIYLATIVNILKDDGKSMIPGIERNDILNKDILIPPLDEQAKIVDKTKTLLNLIQ